VSDGSTTPESLRLWLQLVTILDGWAEHAAAVGPERIEVVLPRGRLVWLDLSWDGLEDLFTAWGYPLEAMAEYIEQALTRLPDDCDVLAYTQYSLEPRKRRVTDSDPERCQRLPPADS